MDQLSLELREKARNIESSILRAFAVRTQTAIAASCGISDATMSRFINGGDLTKVSMILAAAGIELMATDQVAVSATKLQALKVLAAEALSQ